MGNTQDTLVNGEKLTLTPESKYQEICRLVESAECKERATLKQQYEKESESSRYLDPSIPGGQIHLATLNLKYAEQMAFLATKYEDIRQMLTSARHIEKMAFATQS
jgi:hypothetical protein